MLFVKMGVQQGAAFAQRHYGASLGDQLSKRSFTNLGAKTQTVATRQQTPKVFLLSYSNKFRCRQDELLYLSHKVLRPQRSLENRGYEPEAQAPTSERSQGLRPRPRNYVPCVQKGFRSSWRNAP